MPHEYVPRMINLENSDYQIVRQIANERGLGEKGLSAASSAHGSGSNSRTPAA